MEARPKAIRVQQVAAPHILLYYLLSSGPILGRIPARSRHPLDLTHLDFHFLLHDAALRLPGLKTTRNTSQPPG